MKIRTNLTLLTLTFIIMIIAIGSIMFLTFDSVNRETRHHNSINEMMKDMSDLSILTHEYSMYHGERMHQQWLLKYDSVATELDTAKKGEVHAEHLSILESMTSDHKILGELFSRLEASFAKKRLTEENKSKMETDVTFVLEERVVAHALMRVQNITSRAFGLSATMREEIALAQQRASLIVLFSTIGFVILSSCISFFVIRAITGPIDELVRSSDIIGKGNLKHRVDIRVKNEIGGLAAAFNQMTENLRKVTASRDELNKEIVARKEAEEELKSVNQQLRANEQQLRASDQQLRANEEQLRAEITERKKANTELRRREERFRTLLDNLPQKIFLKDRNSTYISCNENYARDLNIKPEEVAGKTDHDFYPKELADKYRVDDERIMGDKKGEDLEERYVQDGQERWVHTSKTPVENENGDVTGILGIFWDVTDRKKMEEEKEEHLRELEVFYNASTGREERIVELKKRVRELEDKLELKQ